MTQLGQMHDDDFKGSQNDICTASENGITAMDIRVAENLLAVGEDANKSPFMVQYATTMKVRTEISGQGGDFARTDLGAASSSNNTLIGEKN